MEDRQVTLFYDSLNYDRAANLVTTSMGNAGRREERTELILGQYDPVSKDALFIDSVKLINEDFTLLQFVKYNTESKVADILGPSTILSDSGFNQKHRVAGTIPIRTTPGCSTVLKSTATTALRVLIGYHTLQTGQLPGGGFGRMYLEDLKQKAILRGTYGTYNEKTNMDGHGFGLRP
jgi:hypothetical protein